MTNPYILLAIALAWVGSIAATGYTAFGMGEDKCQAAESKAEKIAQSAFDKGQEGAAKAIADKMPVQTTIYQKATREIQTNTVYADCKHSASVLLDLNAALTGQRAKPVSSGKLPPASAPEQ